MSLVDDQNILDQSSPNRKLDSHPDRIDPVSSDTELDPSRPVSGSDCTCYHRTCKLVQI